MSIEQVGSAAQPMVSQIENVMARPAANPERQVPSEQAVKPATTSDVLKAQEKSQQDSQKDLSSAVKTANKFMQALAQNLQFSIDKDTEKVVVKLVDNSTKEVVKQIPSEEMLAIAKALDKLQGLLVKEKA
jgi:flagellar protein FlaG